MTTWEATQARIVREASEIQFGRVLVTIISFPFYLIGFVLGLLWFVGTLVWQAGWVGAGQARHTLKRD